MGNRGVKMTSEYRKKQMREYHQKHKEKLNAACMKWYKQHRNEQLIKMRARYKEHSKEGREYAKKWREEHPDEVIQQQRERGRKGGKYYQQMLEHNKTGVIGKRNVIRATDRRKWRRYKQIIAPESEIHHEWIEGTAEYRGIAIVDKSEHRHNIIKPIVVLCGEITLIGVI